MNSTPGHAAARRFAAVLKRYGADLPYRAAAAPANLYTVRGHVRLLTSADRLEWFTSEQTRTWARPAYVVALAGAATVGGLPPATGDTLTLPDGKIYTVRLVQPDPSGGTVWRTRLFVARDN